MTTILIAVGTGVVVLLAGNLPWAGFGPVNGLMTRNLASGTAVPWAILPMTLYLWVYWRFISGAWGASTDRASRRANLRAHRLPSRLWLPSLAAGVVGFATLLALLAVAAHVVELPAAIPIATPPGMPILTVLLLLAMASVVAGVTEEAAFRGYMQSIVERRYGVVIAILINGILFGLLHFGNHPRDVLLMLPYYVAVSAVYGGLTWAADSILPALVLHTAGDVVVLTRWWATGRPEWQLTAIAPQSVWERGIDAPFVFAAVAAMVLAIATCWAYRRVHDMRVTTRVPAAIAASA